MYFASLAAALLSFDLVTDSSLAFARLHFTLNADCKFNEEKKK